MPIGIYVRTEKYKQESRERMKKEIKEHPEKYPFIGAKGEKNHMFGRIGDKNPFYGHKHTEEAKQKNREAHLDEKNYNFGRTGSKNPMFGRKGKNAPNYKGRKRKDNGYINVYFPKHPFSIKIGYIRRSRLVAEKQLGRYLTPEEVVHHINFIKDDDRIENLYVFENQKEHFTYHFYLFDITSNLL